MGAVDWPLAYNGTMVRPTRNALIAAGLLGVVIVAIVAMPKRHRSGDTADKLVGIWTRSARPGHWIAIRMTADGVCEQAAWDEASGEVQRSQPWRWETRDNAILIYRSDPPTSAIAGWMSDLYYRVAGPDQTVPILALTDTELTVQARDQSVVYQRVRADSIFAADRRGD